MTLASTIWLIKAVRSADCGCAWVGLGKIGLLPEQAGRPLLISTMGERTAFPSISRSRLSVTRQLLPT
ncbi:hypothetical protein D3C73_1603970 [compost metagenome]